MKNFFILCACLIALPATIFAQDHVAKFYPTALLNRNVEFGYEYLMAGNSTLNFTAALKIPSNVSSIVTAQFDEQPATITQLESKATGFKLGAEYRFYPGDYSPEGFYIGPYLNFNRNAISFDNLGVNEDIVDAKGAITHFGGGAIMGYQWILGDVFTLDWTFFGIGVNNYGLGLDIEPVEGEIDLEGLASDITTEFEDFPILGDRIESEVQGDKVRTKTGFLFVHFRTRLALGYSF
ncbi:DUF3575 domain-containing protein [Pontibacter sp. G13]|uniref:DUF3575 domain-containing protein n=1 Tax=Pontibacter sp. G13 TaxID=3074898 RepID=UPI00288A26EA|nr:DUF3575 domain-containing protein [Pontibacter sp. G13]WNJ16819.1 DUF3575 domain-containing protein [Pontibacter sp. G13]